MAKPHSGITMIPHDNYDQKYIVLHGTRDTTASRFTTEKKTTAIISVEMATGIACEGMMRSGRPRG